MRRADIQVIKSLDGIQWSAPKTILTQAAESNHLPKPLPTNSRCTTYRAIGTPMWRDAAFHQCKRACRKERERSGVLPQKIRNRGQSLIVQGESTLAHEGTIAEVGNTKDLLLLIVPERNIYTKQISKDGGKSWTNRANGVRIRTKVNLIRLESSRRRQFGGISRVTLLTMPCMAAKKTLRRAPRTAKWSKTTLRKL